MIANPAISAGWFPGSDTGYQGVRRVVQDRLSTPFHWAEFCRWCCWAILLVYLLVPAVYRSLLDIRAALEYMQEGGSKTPVLLLVEVGLFSVVALGLFCAATLFYYMGGCTNVRIMHVASRPESCSQTWWWFLLFDYEW